MGFCFPFACAVGQKGYRNFLSSLMAKHTIIASYNVATLCGANYHNVAAFSVPRCARFCRLCHHNRRQVMSDCVIYLCFTFTAHVDSEACTVCLSNEGKILSNLEAMMSVCVSPEMLCCNYHLTNESFANLSGVMWDIASLVMAESRTIRKGFQTF